MYTVKISAYPKVHNLGHKAVKDIFDGTVVVQEKLDGSQFSFVKVDNTVYYRSRRAVINPQQPPKLFQTAVERVEEVKDKLHDRWIYRGECFAKPKHNCLSYARVPANHVAIFDIDRGDQDYLSPDEVSTEAWRLGFESVPLFYVGKIKEYKELKEFLQRDSILGGVTVEGIVIKNYNSYGEDGKVLMAKCVNESFKEKHASEWKQANPGGKDIFRQLTDSLRTPARWTKARQHLKEAGMLKDSPEDIGLLMKEVIKDIREEESEWIKEYLFNWAWKRLHKGLVKGLAECYKEELAKSNFDQQVLS